jgi:hypothetical protein
MAVPPAAAAVPAPGPVDTAALTAAAQAGDVQWFATPRAVVFPGVTGVPTNSAFIPSGATAGTGGATTPNLAYEVLNYHSSLCLDVYRSGGGDGANVDQWTCNGGQNQYWAFYVVGSVNGDPIDIVINNNSGKCLDVYQKSLSVGANVDQWTCTSGANQDWVDILSNGFDHTYVDYNTVLNGNDLVLDVFHASLAVGANVDQWTSTLGVNQLWYL